MPTQGKLIVNRIYPLSTKKNTTIPVVGPCNGQEAVIPVLEKLTN